MRLRSVDHQRPAGLHHLAKLRVAREINVPAAGSRIVTRSHDRARSGAVDQHHGTTFDRQSSGDPAQDLRDEPVGIAAGGKRAGDVDQRRQVVRLPPQLAAIRRRGDQRP